MGSEYDSRSGGRARLISRRIDAVWLSRANPQRRCCSQSGSKKRWKGSRESLDPIKDPQSCVWSQDVIRTSIRKGKHEATPDGCIGCACTLRMDLDLPCRDQPLPIQRDRSSQSAPRFKIGRDDCPSDGGEPVKDYGVSGDRGHATVCRTLRKLSRLPGLEAVPRCPVPAPEAAHVGVLATLGEHSRVSSADPIRREGSLKPGR